MTTNMDIADDYSVGDSDGNSDVNVEVVRAGQPSEGDSDQGTDLIPTVNTTDSSEGGGDYYHDSYDWSKWDINKPVPIGYFKGDASEVWCGKCVPREDYYDWCKQCIQNRLKRSYRRQSGNEIVDRFIHRFHNRVEDPRDLVEWIPYEEISDITFLAKGGFGSIYTAIWSRGWAYDWSTRDMDFKRDTNKKVVLKCLIGSENISEDFLNEVCYVLLIIPIMYYTLTAII